MKSTDVQLTKIWLVNTPATAWADCDAAATAIIGGKEALCLQSLGDLVRERAVTEYSCIDSNSSQKATGKMTYSDFDIELLFDNTDIAGQKFLLDAMEANSSFVIAFENSDRDVTIGSTGVHGTIVWTEAKVSGDGILYPTDGLVGYKVTISPFGGYTRCVAKAGAA